MSGVGTEVLGRLAQDSGAPAWQDRDDTAKDYDRVHIRSVDERDLGSILGLLRVALGEGTTPRTEVFWRWKHELNPFGRSPIVVAEVDGRVVSLRAFLRWQWRREGSVYAAVRPVDTATHPDWRRRGLFERLTRHLVDRVRLDGAAFLFNTPNPRSGRGYQKLGWQIIGRPMIWMMPTRPLSCLRAAIHRRRAEPDRVQQLAAGSLARDHLTSPHLDGFVTEAAAPHGRLTTATGAAYLRWRYDACPGIGYGTAGSFASDAGALAIFRLKELYGLREVRFVDLLVTRDSASRRVAIEALRTTMRSQGADFASARAVPGTVQAEVLLRSGFVPVPRSGPAFAVRPLGSAGPANLGMLATWNMSIGDLEVF